MQNSVNVQHKTSYWIKAAQHCFVGKEWNDNSWESRNNPTGYHALYYRTDAGEGKAFLQTHDGTLALLPKRVYFVPAFSVLNSRIEGEMEKYFIHFESDLIPLGRYPHLLKPCSVSADALTDELFRTVTDGFGRGGAKEQKAMGAMQILLADILEKIGVPFGGVPKFERVLEHIEQHYSESITVSSLAKMMGLSTVYFSSSFKEIFHVSPKQYILSKRLFESRILLMQTDLSIGEIAHAVGFENENYFSEFFSQKVGISALGFRHAAQKKR